MPTKKSKSALDKFLRVEIRAIFNFRVDDLSFEAVQENLERLREYGKADIVDVQLNDKEIW